MRVSNLVFAGLLAATPLTMAIAQTTGPDLKAGSTGEANAVKNGAGDGTHTSRATGSAAAAGSSTVAGAHKGTNVEKKGATSGGGK